MFNSTNFNKKFTQQDFKMENTTEKQIELLKLCNEKKLTFNYAGYVAKLEVQKYNHKTSEFDLYEWFYLDEENAIENLNKLIEKVKNYK